MTQIDGKTLDKIVKDTLGSIEQSRTQIFDIYEAAKTEMENVAQDVARVKQETAEAIYAVDQLERKERQARVRLMEVTRNFGVHSENDIKAVYEEARTLQIDLAVARAQEQNLKRRRTDLELRLKSLKATVEKAEGLISQVGVVLGYLGNHMEGLATQLESLQQSQLFGAKIIKAQEEERLRVAREIHDGPAQAMANIVFRTEICERLLDLDIGRVKAELGTLRQQARGCLKETRKIIFDLRPMTLDDLGLVPTVRRFMETVCERSAFHGEVRLIGEERRLESHIEVGLFRIIQEALNNIGKHAKAKNAEVCMEFRRDFVAINIDDDGVGFDLDYEMAGVSSFGLMGMNERINLLNGTLNITTSKGQGTHIKIRIPLA